MTSKLVYVLHPAYLGSWLKSIHFRMLYSLYLFLDILYPASDLNSQNNLELARSFRIRRGSQDSYVSVIMKITAREFKKRELERSPTVLGTSYGLGDVSHQFKARHRMA